MQIAFARSAPHSPWVPSATGSHSMNADESTSLETRIAELTRENACLREAVAARDVFLAIAAHELRNPMTPMMGRVSMLKHALESRELSPEQVLKALDRIEALMTIFLKRATALLDVSRINSNHLFVACTALDLCRELPGIIATMQPMADYAGSELVVDIPFAKLLVKADRMALEQIFENLISNAIKYGNGKPVTIRAGLDASAKNAVISVSDQGNGISAESQSRIFERFERAVGPTTDISGFGVGLWVTRQLCDAMKGAIEVHSTPGKGSTFDIMLPVHPDQEIA